VLPAADAGVGEALPEALIEALPEALIDVLPEALIEALSVTGVTAELLAEGVALLDRVALPDGHEGWVLTSIF
jgi:hypothetical protein